MTITENKTVAEIVTENIKTAHIFKKYGIDFCCGGGVSVKTACSDKDIDFTVLEKELSAVDTIIKNVHDYNNWDLNFLMDHIINIHHKYVEESIPLLIQYSDRVATVHGTHYKEVVVINKLFHEVAQELTSHMRKEELVLFPYIQQLVNAEKNNASPMEAHFGTVKNPIRMMESEHENAGDIFKKIAELTNNYMPPEGACNTFKALYSKLDEFEQDLHQHIHLENNILHPKAVQLEQKLIS
ncbi:iron-sulfur cluster repair di-iron protein [Aquimarina sediminis]|uniref:iron-sulfur cluster repair di-iron protein n=1 Tax=Aquimarina sediminis TaxID=2070536 RepID=UPI000CA016D7|nr:iron-sulfur cluster repair di-iron protein [Aquimarina sediminis]